MKIILTIQQLKNLFIAGAEFEKQHIDFNMGEIEEVTALDFGDYLAKELDINCE
jgi:hypothetical protein